MALDAVVYPQEPFGYMCSSFRDYFQGVDDEISGESISRIMDTHSWSYEHQLGFHEDEGDKQSLLTILDNKNSTTFVNMQQNHKWVPSSNSSLEQLHEVFEMPIEELHKKAMTTARSKRRRTKGSKNKEEVENQRMTHITVERNRRKLMNEYLAALRSLMPSSYAHRGDQASIIGGAINFVKQLEQLLQTLEANKSFKNNQQQEKAQVQHSQTSNDQTFLSPFLNFFTFPQYTTTKAAAEYAYTLDDKAAAAAADIEVTIVESHANVKILAKQCPKQLVKLVSTFQNLKLNVQHLNVSSMDHMVLYSVNVKVEEGCKVNTVDEIAAAVNKMLHKIEDARVGVN